MFLLLTKSNNFRLKFYIAVNAEIALFLILKNKLIMVNPTAPNLPFLSPPSYSKFPLPGERTIWPTRVLFPNQCLNEHNASLICELFMHHKIYFFL